MPELTTPTTDAPPVKAAERHTQPRLRRRGRSVLFLSISALLLVAGTVGVYRYRTLTSPEHVLAMVREGLSHLPCPAAVEQASFTFFGGAEIVGLTIGPCGESPSIQIVAQAGAAAPVPPSTMTLRAASVQLMHEPWRLLLGGLQIRRVIAFDPVLDVVGDFKHAARPFKSLGDRARDKDFKLPDVFPILEVQNGTLRLISPHIAGSDPLDQVGVNARALPANARSGTYDVAWQSSAGESGLLQYDLMANRLRDVRGGTPAVSIPAAVSAFVGREKWADRWSRIAQLSGRIRIHDFDFNLRGFDVEPGTMKVDVSGATLAIPVIPAERDLPPAERLLRPQDVRGVADVHTDRIEIRLDGQWRNRPLRFSMTLPDGAAGLAEPGTPAFVMTIDAEDVDLPRLANATPTERRAIAAADAVDKLYREIDPAGPIDLHIEAAQSARAPSPNLTGLTIIPHGASARPSAFPLPIDRINGRVDFTPDDVTLDSVCGNHGGGTICVTGRFDGKDRCAPAELVITGKSAPIDEALYSALGPKLSRIREWFDPAGTIDVRAVSRRPACDRETPQTWITDTQVTLNSIRAIYRELPYEFENLTGDVRIRDDLFSADLSGRIGSSAVTVVGSVNLHNGELDSADLRVSAADLPIDSRLMQAIGDEAAAQLVPFGLTGRLNIESDLQFNATKDALVHSTRAVLVDATVRHERFPVPITNISGPVHFEPGQTVVGPITGNYHGAAISLDGRIPSATAGDDRLGLSVDVVGLRFDDNLIAAAPAELADLLRIWRIDGPVSGRVNLNGKRDVSGSFDISYRGEARLAGVTVRHPNLPVPITAVYGLLSFDTSSFSGADLRGAYGRATLSAELQAYFSTDVQHGRLELSATGIRIDEELLGALPPDASARLRRLQPTGYVDAYLERLQFTRELGRTWDWSGAGWLRLHSVDLPALSLSGVSGDVTFSGVAGNRNEGAMLAGEMQLDRAMLFDHELSRVSTPWSLIRSTTGIGELALDRIQGDIYDGDLSGRLEVRFDPRASEYNLTALAQNMQLGPFLNAGRSTSLPAVEATGRVAANLYLSGESNDPQSLRGGGRFEVLDGNLYKLPIILAILSVLDITARPTDTFDEATADFYIVGRKVNVRDIALRGGLLALVGSGVVALPDLVVDLRLVNVPDQWWARLPVVAEVMQGAVRELVQVRVTGPISQPSVRTDPVPRITDELRTIFQRRTTRKPLAPGK